MEPVETLSGDPTLELPEFDAPPADPLPLLESWLRTADEKGVREPRALALATADAEGRPSVRTLLLKQLSPTLVFAGSYESHKGRDLAANPRAAGTLYWRETLQQITIEGPVEKLSEEESDALFAERPPAGQATTVASDQGRPRRSRRAPTQGRRAGERGAAPPGELGRLPPRPRPDRVLARQPRRVSTVACST